MQDVVIVAATRTPIGSFHGALAPLSAVELGAAVVRTLLETTAVAPDAIDEVIFGQVLTTGSGQKRCQPFLIHYSMKRLALLRSPVSPAPHPAG